MTHQHMASSPGYRVEAVATNDWARDEADDFDNAFGNMIRGNGLDGFTIVLYDADGEVLASQGFEDGDDVDGAVETVLDSEGVDRAAVDSWDLDY
ncbi:hypothetical protein ACKVMT_10115 [Halobacteriales archaeon Cl-PHB]